MPKQGVVWSRKRERRSEYLEGTVLYLWNQIKVRTHERLQNNSRPSLTLQQGLW